MSSNSYFGPKNRFEALFGRSVDLVEPSPIRNPFFKDTFERSREPIFEGRPRKHAPARPTRAHRSCLDPIFGKIPDFRRIVASGTS